MKKRAVNQKATIKSIVAGTARARLRNAAQRNAAQREAC